MIESLYSFLEKVGFYHPLHPAFTHIPMGMVMGCFFFGLLACREESGAYRRTCLHCNVLGLLAIIPTIIFGIFDWKQIYAGHYLPMIVVKMVLAGLLVLLLGGAIFMHRRQTAMWRIFLVYCLCLACAGGLGFSGGELVYSG